MNNYYNSIHPTRLKKRRNSESENSNLKTLNSQSAMENEQLNFKVHNLSSELQQTNSLNETLNVNNRIHILIRIAIN